MSLRSDLRVLTRLARNSSGGSDHAARLDAFYRDQAGDYDEFRKRLLPGRERMMRRVDLPPEGHLIDMGGGTASNLECIEDRLGKLDSVTVVDLCEPLLERARERATQREWTNVHTVNADATTFQPTSPKVDAVTFSYALTMIPDWFEAVDHAWDILEPGGQIGVVDFYVSRKWPSPLRGHSRLQRIVWPLWFSWDNVFLSPDHLPYLRSKFETVQLEERVTTLPYMPGSRVPYYSFIGRKPD